MRTSKNLVSVLLFVYVLLSACAPPATPSPTATSISPTVATSQTTEILTNPTVIPTTIRELSGKFDVNGQSLYIECIGIGSPTIILEPGEGGTHLAMKDLQKRLAARTTTCVYDRAKTGSPRAAQDVADDLHTLLVAAKVPGPFVLVGTSAGGLLVQLYACIFPDEVVGVVAMNPVPPAHPWLDEVSLIFTAQEYADEKAYFSGQNGEPFDYLTSSEQLADSAKPSDIPFEMFISTNAQCEGDQICLKSYSNYEQIERDVAADWPRGNFSQIAAGHEIYVDNIDAAVAAVDRVLTSP